MLYWLLIIEVIGIISFPIVFLFFNRLYDRGWSLSKALGILLIAYINWILVSVGAIEYSFLSVIISSSFLIILSSSCLFVIKKELFLWIGEQYRKIILIESLFLVGFLLFACIRMFDPSIFGTEKFMDFMYINAIGRSGAFPPHDAWLSGYAVNYYYFGYLIVSTLTVLSGIGSVVTYNLALATLFALAIVGGFGICYTLSRNYRYAIMGALFLAICGNLDGLLQLISNIKLIPFNIWQSSRIIPNTINEFPAFTFLWGDLHPHLVSIPFILLALAIPLNLAKDVTPQRFWRIVLSSLIIGSLFFINGWNAPIWLFIIITIFLVNGIMPDLRRGWMRGRNIATTLGIAFLSIVLYMPFHTAFKSQHIAIRLARIDQRTDLSHLLIIFGFFFFILATFIAIKIERFKSQLTRENAKIAGLIALMLFMFVSILFRSWTVSLLLFLIIPIFWLTMSERKSAEEFFILASLSFGIFLILFCELLYFRDFYSSPLERMNTIFKFHLQAWILLALPSSYILCFIKGYQFKRSLVRRLWKGVFVFLFLSTLIFPVFATYTKCDGFKRRPTLDGMHYIKDGSSPGDYDAIEWLNESIMGRPVILEAVGDAYSYYARLSSNTGLPTPVGWANHEALWRDSWAESIRRTEDVDKIYSTTDLGLKKDLLKKYSVEYVYVGFLERKKYAKEGLNLFESFAETVYSNSEVKIFKLSVP